MENLVFPPKNHQSKLKTKKITAIFIILFLFLFLSISAFILNSKNQTNRKVEKEISQSSTKTTSTPFSFTPSPSPTPRPPTFDEINKTYGPCIKLPTLMYHHIQSEEDAKNKNQSSLSVYTDYFEKQMKYLKDKNYKVIEMKQLIDFFDLGIKIPPKSILLTFDDGYEDFYQNAFPILQKYGFPATVFVPTGLIDNPGYLSWKEIDQMKDILFANHTWSHKTVKTSDLIMKREILIADNQLNDHNLNQPKIFAYPYGSDDTTAQEYLDSLGYKAAFTTKHGVVLCKKQRFDLPRIRIGNAPLSSYGF